MQGSRTPNSCFNIQSHILCIVCLLVFRCPVSTTRPTASFVLHTGSRTVSIWGHCHLLLWRGLWGWQWRHYQDMSGRQDLAWDGSYLHPYAMDNPHLFSLAMLHNPRQYGFPMFCIVLYWKITLVVVVVVVVVGGGGGGGGGGGAGEGGERGGGGGGGGAVFGCSA